jgi:hypothetical protein
MDDQTLTNRAFQIADQSMIELLLTHAVPMDGSISETVGGPIGLVNADFQEVTSLADADPAIVEAFEWLDLRGRAELVEGPDGEFIQLKAEEAP